MTHGDYAGHDSWICVTQTYCKLALWDSFICQSIHQSICICKIYTYIHTNQYTNQQICAIGNKFYETHSYMHVLCMYSYAKHDSCICMTNGPYVNQQPCGVHSYVHALFICAFFIGLCEIKTHTCVFVWTQESFSIHMHMPYWYVHALLVYSCIENGSWVVM